MQPFGLLEPTSIEEAVKFRQQLGPMAGIYAGGTELLMAMKEGLLSYEYLINIKRVPGLDTIDATGDTLVIGACVTHRSIEKSPEIVQGWPLLSEMESGVANVRVRVMGTLAGNLCFAEPHSDPATVLLLFDASVRLRSPHGERDLPLADFIVDSYATTLAEDEILTHVLVPRLPPGSGWSYVKFGMLERPTIGVGCVLILDDTKQGIREARLALGSVGPKPVRLPDAEKQLKGISLQGEEFERAVKEAGSYAQEVSDPVNDLYGSVDYKRHLAKVLTERAIRLARNRAIGRNLENA